MTPQERAAGDLAPVVTAAPSGTAAPRGRAGPPRPSSCPRVAAAGVPDPAGGSAEGSLRPGRVPRTPGGRTVDADAVLSPGQKAIAAAMSEDRGPDSLDAHVRRLMKDLGLWGYHPLNSIGSRQGWPDWTILGAWEMHRELKRQNGKPTADQLMVGAKIRAAGGDWDLWRPSCLLSGRIARELAALAGLNAGTV